MTVEKHDAQAGVLNYDLEKEQVKQIALNHFHAYYVRHDMNDVLAHIDEELQWKGSKGSYVAHSRQEFANLLKKDLEFVPDECMMKVVDTCITLLSPECYQVTGELELRLPYHSNIYYSNLRFTMMIIKQEKRFVIKSIHTSSTSKSVLVEEPYYLIDEEAGHSPVELKRQEQYDTVTGLLHLEAFKKLAEKRLLASSENEYYALLCTDINNYEKVNNLYGLQKADQLLADLASLLTSSCNRGIELCCRSVADHIVILISFQEKDDLIGLLKNLCEQFEMSITPQYAKADPQLGIGVYLITNRQETIERMVEFANLARKDLRFHTDSPIAFYDEKIFMQMERARHIESRMKQALRQREFKAFLQPKFNLETGQIVGAEVLVRWINADGSMIYPDDFIPIFEQNGFIIELDFFILEEVCKMINRRINEQRICVPISINQSRILLQNRDYAKKVESVLAQYNTPPQFIELELTERIFRDDLKNLAEVMGKLKELGISWSIDDFGTGYSSLNLLKELPVDIIKIDKSFLDETESSETSKIIIRKTVELTQELDMTVVCEGVETENQADYLRGIRCDVAQGYLYAKPMPMDDFETLLDKEMFR